MTTDELVRELEAARYRAAVAEWALVGVSTSHVRLTVSPEEMERNRLLPEFVVDLFARKAAVMLIRQARIEFNLHADLAAALAHVKYMESHATSNRIGFAPLKLRDKNDIPFRISWPELRGPFRE